MTGTTGYTGSLKTLIDNLIAGAKNRSNHTGTQSADTLTDGSTNRLYTSAEKTKLGGIATAATANRTDAATDTLLAAKADLVGGLIATSQIPALALNTVVTVASRAAMLALTSTQVQPGDVAVDTSTGNTRGSYMLLGADPSVIGNWVLLNAPTDAVGSVNGQTGTVVLAAADVGAAPASATTDIVNNATAIGQISLSAAPVMQAATGTMTAGAFNLLNATSGALTATLPTPARVGQLLVAERVDTSTNLISFGGTIRGVAAVANMPGLGVAGEAFLFVAESLTSWRIGATHKPKALLDRQYAPRAGGFAAYGGLTSVADHAHTPGLEGNYSNGTDTGANCRSLHYIEAATDTIRLLYTNWSAPTSGGGEDAGNAPITIAAGIELSSGTIVPVRFNGALTTTIAAGGLILSDPVSIGGIAAGATIFIRTNVSVTSGGKWPLNTVVSNSTRTGEGYETGTSITDKSKSGTIPTAATYGIAPSAILGTSSTPRPLLIGIGDSIMAGKQDNGSGGTITTGWFGRAMQPAALPHQRLAVGGETAQTWRNLALSNRRRTLVPGATHAIVSYGINDVRGSRTLAQVQADLLAIWNELNTLGIKVWQTTLTPSTTSTDSWATTANQTLQSYESVRTGVNDWIRSLPTPLSGVLDFADTAETARNSGLWKVNGSANYYTTDGLHPSTAAHVALAALVSPAAFVL